MKKNAMRKNLRQSILKSFGRYIAIVAIIALGASMFVGLLMTKSDMVATGQRYMDEQNMFDLRLISSYGWTQEQLDIIAQFDGIVDAEGLIYLDVVAHMGNTDEDSVFRFYAIPEQINKISLRGGRMPESPDECLIDGYHATDAILGTTITIAEDNTEETLDTMVYETYTIVGYVATPLYMDMNRGTTSVGSGSLNTYLYIPREGVDIDYYSEINVTIPGEYDIYTNEYNDAMEDAAERLEPLLEPLAEERFQQIKSDALEAYREGLKEYSEGQWEYWEGKREAESEMADAEQKLKDAEQQIADNEQMLADGEKQLESGRATLAQAQATLDRSRQEYDEIIESLYDPLEQGKALLEASRDPMAEKLEEINSQIQEIDQKLAETEAPSDREIFQLNAQLALIEAQILAADTAIQTAQYGLDLLQLSPEMNAQMIARVEENIQQLIAHRDELTAQQSELIAQREALDNQQGEGDSDRNVLQNQKNQLEAQKLLLDATLGGIDLSLEEAALAIELLDEQFASAEAELKAGEEQIKAGRATLAENEKKIADGKLELEKAKADLEEGWKEYYDGKAEAEEEFAKAEKELADAQLELADAREAIEDIKKASVYVLDRNSNVGYGSLDSASDIVQGVSRVFPAFFLLVAALVCITTMTRMIDEERTQIGTLKALGYSNGAIISKYLIYAGSGAVIGCGLGVIVGGIVFPTILWQAYKIMLYITDGIVLLFNWWLCGVVVLAYTAVMLLVTWYCCRRALEEQPAELIRPKAPEAGKKILLEYLPFWPKISFLNKVTIRNIFRYRQRLAMMMVGIGGCTALLVTGFGLRDSIVNVVNYQFEDVTVYDLQVYFSEGQTQEDQAEFLEDTAYGARNVLFYHQESVELDFDDQTKEIYLMAANSKIQEFIKFRSNEKSLNMPGMNEVMLSVGVAEAMGIDVGDRVVMRNADMQRLELKVSGIYDNHVYNYAIVTPGTLENQWGTTPEQQMALIQVAEGQDVHELSADITDMIGVMNVSVSEDLADMVGNMMEALDLVVWVIVVCAGLLAAIVLYNLTNININERIREIATIKVLGFNSGETAAYVFKENLSLSAVGSIVGLGLGYLLLIFVMSQIKIDMVWFKALALPASYIISIVLTMLAACIVDFIFYFKLEKINMAEALKSVE